MKNMSLFIVLLLMTGLSLASDVKVKPASTMKCNAVVDKVMVCDISMSRLAAHPEHFNDRLVQIFGYLAIDNGQLVLYTNKLYFRYQVQSESILLDIPYKEKQFISSKWFHQYIKVVGKFAVNSQSDERIGALVTVRTAYAPGLRPDVKEDHILVIDPREQ